MNQQGSERSCSRSSSCSSKQPQQQQQHRSKQQQPRQHTAGEMREAGCGAYVAVDRIE